MKNLIIIGIMFLFLSTAAFAECLNSTQLELLNNLSNTTGIDNTTLIGIFNQSCSKIDGLYNITANLNSSLNLTNAYLNQSFEMYYNLSGNVSNFSANLNSTVSLAINTTVNNTVSYMMNSTINDTIINYTNTKYANDKSDIYLSLKNNVTDEFGQRLSDVQKGVDSFKVEVWNRTLTKDELNVTSSDIESRVYRYVDAVDKQISTYMFITLIVVVAGVAGYGYLRYKPNFGVLKGRVNKLESTRMSPQDLDTDEEEDVKTSIKDMRTFILEQDNFTLEARKKVYEKFLNQEIKTENEAIEELMLTDPKGAVKNEKRSHNNKMFHQDQAADRKSSKR